MTLAMPKLPGDLFGAGRPITLAGVPDGWRGAVLARLADLAMQGGAPGLVFVASDGQHLSELRSSLAFFAPQLEAVELPAWDCLPYDRVSPSAEIVARRIEAFARLAQARAGATERKPLLVLTTANALVQRNPPAAAIAGQGRRLEAGNRVSMDDLAAWLAANGFERTPTVRERGEFAVRGGILDVFAPGNPAPARLDFFGDTVETLRSFDAASQRTLGSISRVTLAPMSEVRLDAAAISRFREGYVRRFGAPGREDALYQSVSEGKRFAGMEHWLALFHETTETVFDHARGFRFCIDHHVRDAAGQRHEQVRDYYEARRENLQAALQQGAPYQPIDPAEGYLDAGAVDQGLAEAGTVTLSPFMAPETSGQRVIDLGGRPGRNFAAERAAGANVFEAATGHIGAETRAGKRVFVCAWTTGSRERLRQVLAEHELKDFGPCR